MGGRANKRRKRATTMFYSPLILVASIVIFTYLLLFVSSKKSALQYKLIGSDAMNILMTQQEGELIRFYVEDSARISLDKVLERFKNKGLIIGSGLNDKAIMDELKREFKRVFTEYLKNSPYNLHDDYNIIIREDNGKIVVKGIGLVKESIINTKPIPRKLYYPVKDFNGYYLLLKNGCFGSRINRALRREDPHKGIELLSKDGKVYAVADGTIEEVKASLPNKPCVETITINNNGKITEKTVENYDCYNNYLGNYIIIDHGDFKSVYAHLSSITPGIRKDQKVSAGDKIGSVGKTGLPSDQSKDALFFQLIIKNKIRDEKINPLCYYPIEKFRFENNEEIDCNTACNGALYRINTSFIITKDYDVKAVITKLDELNKIKEDCEKEINNNPNINFKDCVQQKVQQEINNLKSNDPNINIDFGSCDSSINLFFDKITTLLSYLSESEQENCYFELDLNKVLEESINELIEKSVDAEEIQKLNDISIIVYNEFESGRPKQPEQAIIRFVKEKKNNLEVLGEETIKTPIIIEYHNNADPKIALRIKPTVKCKRSRASNNNENPKPTCSTRMRVYAKGKKETKVSNKITIVKEKNGESLRIISPNNNNMNPITNSQSYNECSINLVKVCYENTEFEFRQ